MGENPKGSARMLGCVMLGLMLLFVAGVLYLATRVL